MYRGFTKFARVDYVKWKEENRLVHDGVNAKVRIPTTFTVAHVYGRSSEDAFAL
jgi:hypothetical protein